MTDESYAFVEDVKNRSQLKKSAHCKKNGSFTSKALRHEMTNAEIEARHGECKSWNLGAFLTLEEFLQMPSDIKIRYINRMQDKYDVGLLQINCEVFGLPDDNALKTLLKQEGILKDVYPGTKRKKTGLSQLRKDILNYRKGYAELDKSLEVRPPVPKFMNWEDFKKLDNTDAMTFINRLLAEYRIGITTIDKILFERDAKHARVLSSYLANRKLTPTTVLTSHAIPKPEDVERFKADVAKWKTRPIKLPDGTLMTYDPEENAWNGEPAITEPKLPTPAEMPEEQKNLYDALADFSGATKEVAAEIARPSASAVETKTMAFATEYIGDKLDYELLDNIDRLFCGKKIRVMITVEVI